MPKCMQFLCFFRKCQNVRNYLFSNRKRGSGHLKVESKSPQNLSKFGAKQKHAKSMEKTTQTDPSWCPKCDKNPKKSVTLRRRSPKSCKNEDPEKVYRKRANRGVGVPQKAGAPRKDPDPNPPPDPLLISLRSREKLADCLRQLPANYPCKAP